MILVSRTNVNTNVRELLLALKNAELLHSLHTTISVAEGDERMALLPAPLRKTLLRRKVEISPAQIHCHPWRELLRQASLGLHWSSLVRESKGIASSFQVGISLDREVAAELNKLRALSEQNQPISGVYGYEDSSYLTFKTARERGLKTFYELTIAYWKTSFDLLSHEAQRYPLWRHTVQEILDNSEKLEYKTNEIQQADVVICPSTFVMNSVPEQIARKATMVMAPFGSDLSIPARDLVVGQRNQRLRVLFAGIMTQRKGLADLFAAFKLLNRSDVELVVMGSPIGPLDFYRQQCPQAIFEKGRPRADVLKLMQTCDVFVLPSLVEGRALVVQEAMMSGLPVVITENVGCSDLVLSGENGFLVPIRSPESIAEKLSWFADNRHVIAGMSEKARQIAMSVTWSSYHRQITEVIKLTLA